MTRAVVVGKYNADKDDSEKKNWHLMRQSNKSTQTREAMKLLDQAKIPLTKSCGIEEYKKIKFVLAPKYLIKVHSQYTKDGLIFPLQFKKAETRVIPIYFNGVDHYDAITKVTGFLGVNCCTFHYTHRIQLRLACTSRTIFHGCQIVHWDPPPESETKVSSKNFGMGYVKMHGFHGNPMWI